MRTFILILQIISIILILIYVADAYDKESNSYRKAPLKYAASFAVVFFLLTYFKPNYIADTDPTNSPDGTYYYSNPSFNLETYVYLKKDSTWLEETFESGKLRISEKGSWKLVELQLKNSRGYKTYTLITFKNDNTAYLFQNGCIKPLPDEIISHSDNKYSWAEIPFGPLVDNERCKTE
jgi:hypothetical protein